MIGTFALSEGNGTPKPHNISSTFNDGKLNGKKLPVNDGHVSDFMVVAANTDSSKNSHSLSLVIVNSNQEGVKSENLETIDPSRPSSRIVLNNADAELLGTMGEGWEMIQKVFDRAAVLFAFEQVGGAQVALDEAKELLVEKGELNFTEVSLSYNQTNDNALEKINLLVKAGSTTALVGPSGAGKTSCLNLIPRFYDPSSGRISIDGQDIKNVTIESLRSSISLVSQEPKIFDTTIRDNINYGKINASNEEIIEASKSAAAHDFIMSMPNQYDTIVGENGFSLSGGQKQRISIARAFIKDAPILLLDEATSSCLLYTSPSPRDATLSRMPSSA